MTAVVLDDAAGAVEPEIREGLAELEVVAGGEWAMAVDPGVGFVGKACLDPCDVLLCYEIAYGRRFPSRDPFDASVRCDC